MSDSENMMSSHGPFWKRRTRTHMKRFPTISKIIDEQADVRRLVEELARRMDNARSEGTVEKATQEGSGVAMQLEVNDLKAKVLRLTEQIMDHDAKLNFFSIMSEKVDLLDRQTIRWRHRLPDLTDDENQEEVVSAVEVQEELNRFKDLTMAKVREARDDTNSLDREVHLLERTRSDSWDVISQQLNSMVGDSASAFCLTN